MGFVTLPVPVITIPALQEAQLISTGTWTVPTGVTKVWVDVIGGGGGSSGSSGGNVGGHGSRKTQQLTVTPGASLTVTVGGGGSAGPQNGTGGNGTASVFDSITAGAGGGSVSSGSFTNLGFAQYDAGGALNTAGAANSGSGGGSTNGTSGFAGGSGRIIVRYLA